ncbi:MAG: hypothetical protein WBE20_03140 [Candidatus Acidiferrales bacterium]
MRIRAEGAIGVLLALAGTAALIHPQFSYRIDQHTQQVNGLKTLFEVRRVIHFPLWFSIPILTIGVALFIVGLRKD